MKRVHIKNKLTEIGVPPETVVMGDFDYIGEFTAKRDRKPHDPNYKKHGAFYRSNYERGILVYHLIRQYNLTSLLEIGFGRGFTTFCAARAFRDSGVEGRIVTVDPVFDERYIQALHQVFPKDWFSQISFAKGRSQDVLPTINESFDLVYIDGDHSYEATKNDWLQTREKFNKFMLFDDYHLPTKADSGTIECSKFIDEINASEEGCSEPELLILDRRMFFDDRGLSDDQIDYGQVLFTKTNPTAKNTDFSTLSNLNEW